jgi:hypothetical protein
MKPFIARDHDAHLQKRCVRRPSRSILEGGWRKRYFVSAAGDGGVS